MYRVLYGDDVLFSPLADDAIYDATLTRDSVNAYDYLEFTIPATHPLAGVLEVKGESIKVYADKQLLFDGYIEEIEETLSSEFTVTCVSCLAYLNNTLVRPYSTVEGEAELTAPNTPGAFLEWLIEQHNANTLSSNELFQVGVCQTSAAMDEMSASNNALPTTREEIVSKLLDVYGGFLVMNYAEGARVIDWYTDITSVNAQVIDFGVNLVDIKLSTSVADIYTAIRPSGDDDLTIAGVADGTIDGAPSLIKHGDIIYDADAVERYGYSECAVTFDGIEDVDALLDAATSKLEDLAAPAFTIEASAIDMSLIDSACEHLTCGQAVRARSKPNNLDTYLIVQGVTLDLENPENTVYTLGSSVDTLTNRQADTLRSLNAAINTQLDRVNALDADVKAGAIAGEDATTLRIDSTRGTVFKNNEVSTVLNVVIYRGGLRITDTDGLYEAYGGDAYLEWSWQRMGEDTFGLISADDSRLSNGGFSMTLSPQDVDTKAVFLCQLITNEGDN